MKSEQRKEKRSSQQCGRYHYNEQTKAMEETSTTVVVRAPGLTPTTPLQAVSIMHHESTMMSPTDIAPMPKLLYTRHGNSKTEIAAFLKTQATAVVCVCVSTAVVVIIQATSHSVKQR